jgi:hypothetical protein
VWVAWIDSLNPNAYTQYIGENQSLCEDLVPYDGKHEARGAMLRVPFCIVLLCHNIDLGPRFKLA